MIVDSSALIPLSKIGRLNLIKNLEDVKTTKKVKKETVKEGKGRRGTSKIKEALEEWIQTREIRESERVKEISDLEGISRTDASLLLMAERNNKGLLTNDKALIRVAETRGITTLWVTTLILKHVKEGSITKEEAKELLYKLIETGMNLNSKVYSKILKKINKF